ncbi:MAG: hypothetical protein II453_10115 [Alphaproteobacteria bacterium]|nr:hypothetical protein [Alphaproteobacteria bacterium]MBQ3946325.1 hypothetical protein [Alphaproteobacteria bacterium]
MAKQEIIFVDGMKVKKRFENLYGVSINLENFNKFAEAHKNKGYLNIDICKSKDKEVWYARLNTWTPTKQNNDDPIVKFDDDDMEIPF